MFYSQTDVEAFFKYIRSLEYEIMDLKRQLEDFRLKDPDEDDDSDVGIIDAPDEIPGAYDE